MGFTFVHYPIIPNTCHILYLLCTQSLTTFVDKYSSQQQTGSMQIYTYTYITEHSCRFQVQQHDDSVSTLSGNCVANKAKNTGDVSKCEPKRKVLQIWYVVSNHQTFPKFINKSFWDKLNAFIHTYNNTMLSFTWTGAWTHRTYKELYS